MPDLPRIPIRRVLSDEEGREAMGEVVPARDPTVTKAGVYVDEESGEPVLCYAPYPAPFAPFRRALLATPMSSTPRGFGMRNVSRTFGFAPKSVPTKRESCRPASLAYDSPEAHAAIVAGGRTLDGWLAEEVPEVVDRSRAESAGIADDWRLAEDVYWTSGVINSTSALPYHRDRNNFPVWSAMPVARRGVRGGHLSVPEYDATIACRDGWVVCFNGYALTHGVTPIRTVTKDAYRLSCVFYCLRGMVNCADDAREQGRARARRTEREREIAAETPESLAEKFPQAGLLLTSAKNRLGPDGRTPR